MARTNVKGGKAPPISGTKRRSSPQETSQTGPTKAITHQLYGLPVEVDGSDLEVHSWGWEGGEEWGGAGGGVDD